MSTLQRNNLYEPVFIIGLSRSGTKLLRDLLNNHSKIFIPNYETHFIPSLIKENKDNFNLDLSLGLFKSSKFYQYFNKRIKLDEQILKSFVDNSERKLQAFIKYTLTTYGYGSYTDEIIWGDKTPKNLRHIEILNEVFPQAKFIHIVRDPRDRCISVKKTWWKSIYRAAYLWNKEIHETEEFIKKHKKVNYIEVHFEELLSEPAVKLHRLCNFLGIDYEEGMTSLNKPSEKYGAASSTQKVVKDNKNKFLDYDHKVIEQIEQICYPMLKQKGYKVFFATSESKLSPFKLAFLKLYDGFMFRLSVKIKGY